MSAITGIMYKDKRKVDSTEVERMISTMRHRGPHAENVWCSNHIGLGNSLLHCTPESLNETQPFTRGHLTITADARIDNRAELLNELAEEKTTTDSELILFAYEKWGEDCLQKLIGDFAFAIWDELEQTLFCARDFFGSKPFYYFNSDKFFAFASEQRALLSNTEIPKRINETRIADYFFDILEGADKTSTLYLGIFRLPPAKILKVTSNSFSIRSYWSLNPQKEVHFNSDSDYEEAFREIFTEAVNCRLRTVSAPASMLSGGLDSSAIVCIARDLLQKENKNLKTFSAVSVNQEEDIERPFIDDMLKAGDVDPTLVNEHDLVQLKNNLTNHICNADDIFFSPDIPYIMYGFAQKQGLSVLLDGVDGDCVTSPNNVYFSHYALTNQWIELFREVKGFTAFYKMSNKEFVRLLWNNGVKTAIKRFVPKSFLENYRFGNKTTNPNPTWLKESFLNLDFAREIKISERMKTIQGDTEWGSRHFRESDCQTLKQAFLVGALERYDRIAAMHSIESRHPFFDKRLVEFCLALPLKQKAGRGVSKAIIRKSLKNKIPEKTLLRGSSAVNLNLRFCPAIIATQEDLIAEVFSDNLKDVERYVNVEQAKTAYKEFKEKNRTENYVELWRTVCLTIWLRQK